MWAATWIPQSFGKTKGWSTGQLVPIPWVTPQLNGGLNSSNAIPVLTVRQILFAEQHIFSVWNCALLTRNKTIPLAVQPVEPGIRPKL
jgi:hypothetical protein